MVSVLIIQNLFSPCAFGELALMRGQIDLYEIIITAFFKQRAKWNHQIGKDTLSLVQYDCIYPEGRIEKPHLAVSVYSVGLSVICHDSLTFPVSICFLSLE